MSIASQILGDEGAQSLGDFPSTKLACTMGPCVSFAESLDVCLLGAAIDPDSLDSHSLFVGDLPHELSDTELHQHFQAFFPSAKSAKVGCTPWPAVIVSSLCTAAAFKKFGHSLLCHDSCYPYTQTLGQASIVLAPFRASVALSL